MKRDNTTLPPIAYKPVDPRCDVSVRELNRHKVARRLIANNKRKIASAGLIVDVPISVAAGALVEIDLSFPGITALYRSRGIVDWCKTGDHPGSTKAGVLIFGMDKIDPTATPAPSLKPSTEPENTVDPPAETPSKASASDALDPESTTPPKSDAPPGSTDPIPVTDATANVSSDAATDETPITDATAQKRQPGFTLPDEEDMSELITGLVDEQVDVRLNTDKQLTPKRFAAIGVYENDQGIPVLLLSADIALANYLGSALLMMPADEAENAVKNGTMSNEVQESFQEICNIFASIFNDAGNQHIKFAKMHSDSAQTAPANIVSIIESPSNKMDLYIDVPGYGKGRLAILDGTWK